MQSKGSKSMIMILVLLAAMFFGYMSFFNGGDGETSDDMAAVEAEQSGAGQEVIAILNRLQGLTLDNSIFSQREFQALVDQTVAVEDQPVGGNNPFAPIGSGGFTPSASAISAASATTTPAKTAPSTGSIKAN